MFVTGCLGDFATDAPLAVTQTVTPTETVRPDTSAPVKETPSPETTFPPEETPQPTSNPNINDDLLTVRFIDVGQGDCILVRMGGETMLIDCGEKKFYGRVADALAGLGITEIDHLVATHPHSDHIGGMEDIVKNYEINNIYMPKIEHDTRTYENLLDAIEAKGLMIDAPAPGTVIYVGGAAVTFLGPVNPLYKEINDNSIVLRIEYGNFSCLITGDIMAAAEKDILAQGLQLQSTVIKAPHHGSSSSSSQSFVDAVAPEYAVILVGAGNSYNHPNEEVVQRYRQAGAEVLTTRDSGDISFITDGTYLTVSTEKSVGYD